MLWEYAPDGTRSFLLISIFAVMCLQIFCLLRGYSHVRKALWAGGAGCFAAMFVILYGLCEGTIFNRMPVFAIAAVTGLSAALTVLAVISVIKKEQGLITRSSIKEAMDDLPLGGCYFTESGRIKLCNRQMYMLFHEMTGQDLQSLEEMHTALAGSAGNGISRTHDGGYRFPDGRIWLYSEREVRAGDGRLYTEAVFMDATELSGANEELHGDNRELIKINRKLQKCMRAPRNASENAKISLSK